MESTEVIVVGGGPAGSTCAALLAMRGRKVVLLDKEQFPRFVIGESLLAAAWEVWTELGMAEKIEQVGYPVKRGVLFRIEHENGWDDFPILTAEFPEYFIKPYTFHVDRVHYDKMMLDNAREKGVDVRLGCNVTDVIFEGSRAVGVHYTDENGEKKELRCTMLVDATGRRTVLGHKLARRYVNPQLKKVSYYTHFKGAGRRRAEDGSTMTDIHSTDGGWIWYIPLRDDVVSVGVVLDAEYVQKNEGGPKDFFERALARDPQIKEWLEGSTQHMELKHVPSISYLNDNFVGDGFLMLGDASLFIDPIFSAGVQFCMRGGWMAADVITKAFASGDFSEAALKPYELEIRKPMAKMYNIITNWYEIMRTKDRNNLFARSMRAPLLRQQLVIILSGGYDRADLEQLMEASGSLMDAVKAAKELQASGAVPAS